MYSPACPSSSYSPPYLGTIIYNITIWTSHFVESILSTPQPEQSEQTDTDPATHEHSPSNPAVLVTNNSRLDNTLPNGSPHNVDRRSHRIERAYAARFSNLAQATFLTTPYGIRIGRTLIIRSAIVAFAVAITFWGTGELLFNAAAYDILNDNPNNLAIALDALNQGSANLPIIAGAIAFLLIIPIPYIFNISLRLTYYFPLWLALMGLLAVWTWLAYESAVNRLKEPRS